MSFSSTFKFSSPAAGKTKGESDEGAPPKFTFPGFQIKKPEEQQGKAEKTFPLPKSQSPFLRPSVPALSEGKTGKGSSPWKFGGKSFLREPSGGGRQPKLPLRAERPTTPIKFPAEPAEKPPTEEPATAVLTTLKRRTAVHQDTPMPSKKDTAKVAKPAAPLETVLFATQKQAPQPRFDDMCVVEEEQHQLPDQNASEIADMEREYEEFEKEFASLSEFCTQSEKDVEVAREICAEMAVQQAMLHADAMLVNDPTIKEKLEESYRKI